MASVTLQFPNAVFLFNMEVDGKRVDLSLHLEGTEEQKAIKPTVLDWGGLISLNKRLHGKASSRPNKLANEKLKKTASQYVESLSCLIFVLFYTDSVIWSRSNVC